MWFAPPPVTVAPHVFVFESVTGLSVPSAAPLQVPIDPNAVVRIATLPKVVVPVPKLFLAC
jgi:hypothetical protein